MKSLRAVTAVVALAVVAADQVTKHWALNALDSGRVIDVLGSLRLNLAFNTGMAFAKGQGIGPLIAVVGLLVIAYLLVGLRRESRSGAIFVGLVAGGAAGNIIDRLFRGRGWFHGAVVDFIDLQWWPVFNVADSAISVGAVLLVLSALRDPARSDDNVGNEGAQ